MKRTVLDRFIDFFSPKSEYDRLRFRRANELIRNYEAANLYATSDWSTASRTSANAETRIALLTVRDRSRDLVRNNGYAARAIDVIVNNTVGAGIQLKIDGRTKTQTKRLTDLWKQWAETTNCDFNGKYNFYGMQAAVMRSIVEGGEIVARKLVAQGMNKIQVMEGDFINPNFSNNIDNIQGIWIDPKTYKILAYELYLSHPGDWRAYQVKSIYVPADQIIHAYRIDRIGQYRGMPWLSPVMNALKDFADYQNATLIRQKVAACFTAFVTEKDTDILLDQTTLKNQRAVENSLEPGTMRYLSQGQDIKFANPPGVDQYDPFSRQTLRLVASGLGISYEAFTGDYSQVNFSSGRMGHLEMQRNVDAWRWQMLIPQFCDPAFEHFLNWCELQGIDTTGVTHQWTPPAREMIDPTKEIDSLVKEVRAGFKSLPEAIRERGFDPDDLLEEIADSNAALDKLGLVLDCDPRRMTATGIAQSASAQPSEPEDESVQPNDKSANEGNGEKQPEENASNPPSSSGAEQRK